MRAKEMHHDIMELTAHSGAREEHARWQGKLVSLSGKKGYLSLRDIGCGEPGGFKGINCRHNWHMYFKGMPRAYTDKELKDMQNEKVVYNGQPIPVWKAREYQRSLERGIKKNKRELIMCDEARKYTDDKDLKAGLDIDFQNAAKKLKAREKNLKDFCRQTGLKYDSSRVQVFSAETERGIRNWDKSIAQKAVAANKQALTKERENDIIKENDIKIHHSLSAAAFRDNILLPNGNTGKIKEGSTITKVVAFAGKGTNKELRVAKYLEQQYGVNRDEWKHSRGDGYVVCDDGKTRHAELHWFECKDIGRIKMKVKRYFNDES